MHTATLLDMAADGFGERKAVIEFRPALPCNETGKLLRRVRKEELSILSTRP
jgi:acyl-coenzyme A synthetase/AMP-(fatty) acid ligase